MSLRGALVYGTMMRLAVSWRPGLWRSWERVCMACRRSGVRIPSGPPVLVLRGLAFHPARAKGFFVHDCLRRVTALSVLKSRTMMAGTEVLVGATAQRGFITFIGQG